MVNFHSFLVFTLIATSYASTKVEDCVLTEENVCYYCDSHHNEHCGNPFGFSHFYVSTEVYMTACYGCCVKIVHPIENGERRIIRSCVENHPHLNITLNDDCNNDNEKDRQVCLCGESLCNASNKNAIVGPFAILLTVFLLMLMQRL